ncbi:hypothetical protein BN2497_1299 [Janthinobacterium sp. CG23_2]|nr:hypothetical protein BN2497_1299 [Janthinobacterium sp. CG23_2]CUU27047.1 hypothetical protein BN3177_1299 [Janthinobacterium sp. CG23_2]
MHTRLRPSIDELRDTPAGRANGRSGGARRPLPLRSGTGLYRVVKHARTHHSPRMNRTTKMARSPPLQPRSPAHRIVLAQFSPALSITE